MTRSPHYAGRPARFAAAFAAANVRCILAFLAMLLLPISAQAEDVACGGTDLVAQLAVEDPALLRQMREEAAATPNGWGLLWRIEGEGSQPSWLFGTMHMTDPRVTRLPDGAGAAFAEARTVVIETTDILDRPAMMGALFAKPELTTFPAGESLIDHLTPEERDTVDRALRARGVTLQSVVKMKPWMLVSFVSLPECELQRQQAGTSVLDVKLANEAKAAGKQVAGLETVDEQLAAMASLPIDLHVKGLVATLALGDRVDDMIETMIGLYLNGETGMVRPALGSLLDLSEAEAADYAAFERRMVEMRNHVMAERAIPLIEEGGVFIAVGAMHLPGQTGLVELLRRAGYQVSRAE